ncbi:MG2 domain-containing protein [Fulvivirga maritima]|uniref:alpha-2-macroglobulin family protein n=1 Tax=Fulvivirga maritima TaxID=2904247 RepID=UPI001F309408|nr:MG2 domain-containing protein [Fulvivirga maritima]UII29182.1 MG2 domain-containing protein [Fulvivirga maritima]
MLKSITGKIVLFSGLLVVLAVAGIAYLNQDSKAETVESATVNPAFSAYITSYTAGVVPSGSSIRIRLAKDVADSTEYGKEIKEKLFDFSPSIKGKAIWVDSQTAEFQPSERLKSGETYSVNFHLSELLEVADELATFSYQFQIITQNYDVSVENIETEEDTELKKQNIIGVVYTADFAAPEDVEKLLEASQKGSALPVVWQHAENEHHFVISEVKRSDEESKVILNMHGEAIGVDRDDEKEIVIPALGDFKVVDVRVVQSPSQYLVVQFSDPLKPKQNLDGLITIEGLSSLDYDIKDNQVYVYPPVRQAGDKKVTISSGIRNVLDYRMKTSENHTVTFAQVSPDVRTVGKGNILPSSDGLILPFEAVSLKAVDVEIIKIYENNIIQFLQSNDLGGNRYLRSVGRPVLRKTVPLNTSGIVDLGKWNRFTLDLAELISTEPGAIYQVRLSFRKYQSVYYCGESEAEEDMQPLEEMNWEEDERFNAYDSYRSYNYNPDYRWRERDNPCHVSYYIDHDPVIKNVLASDLGVIAKRGNSGELNVWVTDLKTTEPKGGVRVDVYNFQQQVIGSAITDADGMIIMDVKERPFVVVATDKQQKGYLKLDDGSSLSLSNFNVSGSTVQEGLKGYIYGERGVWRPGDTLHLTFVLEDKLKKIPETHPVIMELYNPSWQLAQKTIRAEGENGFYKFEMVTSPDAPTGNWTASVKVGGVEFSKTLKIETVKPNRLKIKLDFGKDKITSNNNQVNGDLTVSWLHGAPARNLKAEFEMLLAPAKTSFEKYPAYNFDDPARHFSSESKKIFEGYVNEEGKATVNASLATHNEAPGMLKAYFTGKVFEEGGNFSIDNFSLPYYPYEAFVGMKLPETKNWSRLYYNKTNQVDIATVDAEGNPVSRKNVEIEVYRLDWRWWWNQDGENIANYISRSSLTPVVKGTANTTNGKGVFNFDLDDWGRYYIRVCDPVSGHCTGEVHYTSWGGSRDEMPGGATMLTFSADKEKYQVGEEVSLKIPSSNKGRALVSIENGSQVLESHWVNTQQGETNFVFEVTEEMAPNIYVFVTLIQEHKQTVNDLPIRLYGVISLGVENPKTILQPQIAMPDVLEPGQEVSITVSEKDKKKMTFTVAVVDEGLLDLTHFPTPNPWGSFYAREALGVKTWDLFDYVMGSFGGKVERLLAIGGDEEGTKNATAKANRFKPVVKYMGPFTIEPGESKTHKFTMPQYVGSVRTMVVAGNQGAYGNAEKATPVRQALMVLGTLPRVLGPDEVVKLPVTVFAAEKKVKNVKVQIEANELFEIVGGASKNITFNEVGEQVVYFDLKVKSKLGIGKVKINASGAGERSHADIELDVRNPNPPMTKVIDVLLQQGEDWNTNFEAIGMAGTNLATLEVSNIPPINLQKRLKYLIQYPHGCIEQTTSSVFPQLYLSSMMKLDEKEKQKIERNINAGISRLRSFQKSDGGFSYWPGGEDSNSWGSSYAGHFLIEAEKRGYSVPTDIIRKWKRYQRRKAAEWRNNNGYYSSDLMQAYRLYTLALAGAPETGAMNRLREEGNLSVSAAWRLAAAYAKAGQKEAAQKLVSNLSTTVKDYRELGYSYGSSLRDEAMILETLSLLGNQKQAFSLLKRVSERMASDQWMSTQTTAYCLISIGHFTGNEKGTKAIKYTYTVNSGKAVTASTELPLAQSELDMKETSTNSLKVQNDSEGILYARIILEGTPVRGKEEASSNNLKMRVEYMTTNGDPIDPSHLQQGTDFVAEVTVVNPGLRGRYENLALSQIFPSGWEIHNARLNDMDQFTAGDVPDYQDIRDDRVYTYFALKRNQSKTFRILLNASYQGTYYMPAIQCEAMYDNSISATLKGKEVEVVKAGGIQ